MLKWVKSDIFPRQIWFVKEVWGKKQMYWICLDESLDKLSSLNKLEIMSYDIEWLG